MAAFSLQENKYAAWIDDQQTVKLQIFLGNMHGRDPARGIHSIAFHANTFFIFDYQAIKFRSGMRSPKVCFIGYSGFDNLFDNIPFPGCTMRGCNSNSCAARMPNR